MPRNTARDSASAGRNGTFAAAQADPTEDDAAAVQLDPEYAAGTHTNAAKNWSAAMQNICLLLCEEYADLQKEIAAYRDKTGQ